MDASRLHVMDQWSRPAGALSSWQTILARLLSAGSRLIWFFSGGH